MINIVLTGGSGFIGGHLLPRLMLEGHNIWAADSKSGDISEVGTWGNFPDAEIVIHLAAKTFVPESWNAPAEYIKTNFLGTVQALEYCRARKSRLIFLSSYMYGEPDFLPIPETAILAVNNPYALSKQLAENACQFYYEKFGVFTTIFRPFNAYGAGQNSSFLIPSIIQQARLGNSIQVQDLAPKRDFIYIKDLVDAIALAVDLSDSGGIFNIGSGASHSVSDLIATIQKVLGTTLPVFSANKRRPGEIMDTVADISNAQKVFGWKPNYSLSDGLMDMLTNP